MECLRLILKEEVLLVLVARCFIRCAIARVSAAQIIVK